MATVRASEGQDGDWLGAMLQTFPERGELMADPLLLRHVDRNAVPFQRDSQCQFVPPGTDQRSGRFIGIRSATICIAVTRVDEGVVTHDVAGKSSDQGDCPEVCDPTSRWWRLAVGLVRPAL